MGYLLFSLLLLSLNLLGGGEVIGDILTTAYAVESAPTEKGPEDYQELADVEIEKQSSQSEEEELSQPEDDVMEDRGESFPSLWGQPLEGDDVTAQWWQQNQPKKDAQQTRVKKRK